MTCRAWRWRSGRAAVLPVVTLLSIMLVTVCAPLLATHNPRAAVADQQLQAPSRDHWLGTDLLGRDVYSRTLHGGRRTLGLALLAAAIALGPGLLVGLVAGYAGRALDVLLMTGIDALLAFPNLLLALLLVAVLGRGLGEIALAVGVAGAAPVARVVRALTLEARTRGYVQAARSLGARPAGILWRHVVPTVRPAVVAFAGVTFSWALLNGAALVFLGYGGDVGAPDWGVMLAEGRQSFRTAPWVAAAPGALLSLTVWAVNRLATADSGEPPGG